MSSIRYLLTRCFRCGTKFELKVGMNLTDFCSTCRCLAGRRMTEPRQHQLNSNYRFQQDLLGPRAEPHRPLVFMGRHFVPKRIA